MKGDEKRSVVRAYLVAWACLAFVVLPVPAEPETGHERMVQLLRQVREESHGDNAYLGAAQVGRLETALAAAGPEAPAATRWAILMQLGKHELRLGREERALAHYEKALALVEASGGEVPLDDRAGSLLAAGVAQMRVGETKNCAQRHTSDSCIFPIQGRGVHEIKEPSRRATGYFQRVLELVPAFSEPGLRARLLLNVAYMTLGEYPAGVPDSYRIDPAAFAADEDFPRFVDVAPQLGLNPFDLAGGAVADDFDGDGSLDLLTSTSDTGGRMHLWSNNGDGTFTERAAEAGLSGMLGGLNLTAADYDNDGDTDVYVLRGGWFREHGKHPNSLLRNDGNGNFTDVTFETGLGEVHYPTQTASWADYDVDGDLDLYVGNEHTVADPAPGQLFRNDGGTFTDVAATAGVENLRYAKGVAWGDYDTDGDPDLFVSNLGHQNRLYRNNGDGTFTDVAESAGVMRPLHSFACWFWDYDNDGALDLLVTAYGGVMARPDAAFVAADVLGLPHRAETTRLYRGDGKGGFRDVSEPQRIADVTLPMGANFGDLDNDGFPDFYLGTGYPGYEGLIPNRMYRNRDGSGFAEVTTAGGFGHLQKGHAIVFADLDDDGDQDVYEQLGGAYPGDAFGNALFENPGPARHWLKVSLVGDRSNREGVGARLRLETENGGVLWHLVGRGGSFGAKPARQEIGLGDATGLRTLEVYWPGVQAPQRFEDVSVDRWVEIREGDPELRSIPLRAVSFGKGAR